MVFQICLRPHFFFFLYLCYSGCIISIDRLFSLITRPLVSSYLLLIHSNEFFILSNFLTPEFSFDLFYNFYCFFFSLYLVRYCYHSFNTLGVVSFNFEDIYDDCFEVIICWVYHLDLFKAISIACFYSCVWITVLCVFPCLIIFYWKLDIWNNIM